MILRMCRWHWLRTQLRCHKGPSRLVSEPAVRSKPATLSSSTGSQRKWSVILSLARLDVNGDRPDAEPDHMHEWVWPSLTYPLHSTVSHACHWWVCCGLQLQNSNWSTSCENECLVRIRPSIHPSHWANAWPFAKAPDNKKPRLDLKARAAEIERTTLKAVIALVEVSQLVDLSELLDHHVVKEGVVIFNSNGTDRRIQKSQLIQKLSLQPVYMQEPYIAFIGMGIIWRMAIPSAEDRQTQDGTPYKWLDYVHKLSSIILARYSNAERIICVNDPYDTAYSSKDNERDLRIQGNTHVPNTYMKLSDPFPSARAFSTLMCSISNKRRMYSDMQIPDWLTVGSNCTNMSTQQSMQNYSFDQSDTFIFSAYAVLREFCYTGPVVIDAADTDAYSSHNSCLACFVSRESRRQSSAVTWWQTRWPAELCSCTVRQDAMPTQVFMARVRSRCSTTTALTVRGPWWGGGRGSLRVHKTWHLRRPTRVRLWLRPAPKRGREWRTSHSYASLQMQIAYAKTAFVQTTWHILCNIPPWNTTPHQSDMAGNWWMVAVGLSATFNLLFQNSTCTKLNWSKWERWEWLWWWERRWCIREECGLIGRWWFRMLWFELIMCLNVIIMCSITRKDKWWLFMWFRFVLETFNCQKYNFHCTKISFITFITYFITL